MTSDEKTSAPLHERPGTNAEAPGEDPVKPEAGIRIEPDSLTLFLGDEVLRIGIGGIMSRGLPVEVMLFAQLHLLRDISLASRTTASLIQKAQAQAGEAKADQGAILDDVMAQVAKAMGQVPGAAANPQVQQMIQTLRNAGRQNGGAAT